MNLSLVIDFQKAALDVREAMLSLMVSARVDSSMFWVSGMLSHVGTSLSDSLYFSSIWIIVLIFSDRVSIRDRLMPKICLMPLRFSLMFLFRISALCLNWSSRALERFSLLEK